MTTTKQLVIDMTYAYKGSCNCEVCIEKTPYGIQVITSYGELVGRAFDGVGLANILLALARGAYS